MTIEIKRTGETSRYWTGAGWEGAIEPHEEGIAVRFKIASKGGGVTQVLVVVKPDSFEEVASRMVFADKAAAVSAFSGALGRLGRLLKHPKYSRERD